MAAMEVPFGDLNPKTCVVLGGRGFLGRSLVSRLLQLGNWIVRLADSCPSLQLDSSPSDSLLKDALSSGRASYHPVDVRDVSQIVKAFEGSSVVFYMESADLDLWKRDFYLLYMIIVQGAKNVIHACRECKVRKLIYNSSADVIFDGSHDIYNKDESLPCHWRFDDVLSELKAQAEALILFANNIDGLLTCALRPSNVFGPGDTQLIPLLVDLAKSGWGKFIIGNGENLSDFTYSENIVHAHICAAEALDSQMVSVAGKAFFITNLEPVKFWDFVSFILEGLGYQRPLMKIPAGMVWYFLLIVRWANETLGFKRFNHSLSAHFFHLASRTRTFNCTAAQKQIGYSPIVSLDDGITSTIESFSQLASDSSFMRYKDFEEQSKVEKFLGGGKVAEILLWRDERKTFSYFLAFALLFYWFLLSGRTFTSSAAKLLLLMTTTIYGYGFLPAKISSFTIQRMPLTWFEVSETVVKDSVRSIVSMWNRGACNIRLLSQGNDWRKFMKVALLLYILKASLKSLTVVVGIALVFAFTSFFVYEQYESEIEGIAKLLSNRIKAMNVLLVRNLHACLASFLPIKEMSHKKNGAAHVKDER